MNEFDQLEQQRDLEVLNEMVPSWVNERIEPFIPNPVDAVIAPVYNDVRFDPFSPAIPATGGGTPSPGSVSVVITKQVGSTMVPVLMTPVEGTLFNDL